MPNRNIAVHGLPNVSAAVPTCAPPCRTEKQPCTAIPIHKAMTTYGPRAEPKYRRARPSQYMCSRAHLCTPGPNRKIAVHGLPNVCEAVPACSPTSLFGDGGNRSLRSGGVCSGGRWARRRRARWRRRCAISASVGESSNSVKSSTSASSATAAAALVRYSPSRVSIVVLRG